MCFCRNLSMRCCTVLVIVPITQPCSSSSLSLPCSVSSSSSSSPSSPSSELGRPLRLSAIANSSSWNIFSGFLVVNPASSACVISSCSCWTAAAASPTRFLAPAVSLSTKSSIHFSFSSMLKKCVSGHFSAASFYLDNKLRNAPRARTLSASRQLLPSFAWWRRWFDRFVDFPFLPAGSGKKFSFRALTILVCVDCVVRRDVGCLRVMDNMEASCVLSVKVGTFTHLEQSKIFLLSVN